VVEVIMRVEDQLDVLDLESQLADVIPDLGDRLRKSRIDEDMSGATVVTGSAASRTPPQIRLIALLMSKPPKRVAASASFTRVMWAENSIHRRRAGAGRAIQIVSMRRLWVYAPRRSFSCSDLSTVPERR
jgi:hypothetical protein